MGQDGAGAFSAAFRTRLRHGCGHDGAREIRMYTPYAHANGVRLRLQGAGPWRHVSALYEIPGGWAWAVCGECSAGAERARRRAVGD